MYSYIIVLSDIVTGVVKVNRSIYLFLPKPMIVKGMIKYNLEISSLYYTLMSGTISAIFLTGNVTFWQESISEFKFFQIL